MRKLIVASYLLLCQCLWLNASPVDYRTEMFRNLDIIEHTLSIGYAPAVWKYDYLGWNLQQAKHEAIEALQKLAPTTKTFQRVLRDYFAGMRDHHAGAFFFSTELSLIPLHLRQAEGRFFVVHIDRDFAHMLQLQGVNVGDELLAVDEVPVTQWFEAFMKAEFPADPTPSDIALATMKMFERSGMEALSTPSGSHTLTLRSKNGRTKTVQARWFHLPEMIHGVARSLPTGNPMAQWSHSLSPLMASTPTLQGIYQRKFLTPFLREYLTAGNDSEGGNGTTPQRDDDESAEFRYIGHKNSLLPPLGKVLWKAPSSNTFEATIQQLGNGKKIGFVRLPTYSITISDNTQGIDEISDFLALMKKFQKETDLLVIDQMDNGGGLVFYMYTLASMLTDKHLAIPHHTILLTSQEVDSARTTLESLVQIEQFLEQQKYKDHDLLPASLRHHFLEVPLTKGDLKKMVQHFRNLLTLWQNGETTTPPLPLAGIESIPPHPDGRYTKPVVILTNELDISCGDFFPAILQDNGRAKVFGAATAGAGGAVTIESHPNRLGISFYSYTKTIGWRQNGQALENLGVTPDMPCPITAADLQDGYRHFKERLIEYIDSLTP